MRGLWGELRRRNVFRVAASYVVVGWLIAEVITTIEEPLSLPDWTDTLAFVLLLAGLPVALILAWAFEVTPEGVKLTASVDEADSITPRTVRKLDYVIALGLAAVIAFIVVDRAVPEAPRARRAAAPAAADIAPAAASIAVLPFADLSADGDQDYFSDGVAEELLNVLTRVDGLRVASRTSAFAYKGQARPLPEIAAELRVRHVLEGSVRKAGEAVRVSAQLIDAESDRQIWSDTFDRQLTAENLFAIQDEIASAIVAELGRELDVDLPAEAVEIAPATEDLGAYDLYLQARPLFQGRRELDRAEALLAAAVERDPDFVDAWALRAAVAAIAPVFGPERRAASPAEIETAQSYIDRALALDADNTLALALGGFVASQGQDIGRAMALYDRALENDPNNVEALNWRGVALGAAGSLEAGLADFRRCAALDPYYVACRTNAVIYLDAAGQTEEALAAYEAALADNAMSTAFLSAPLFSMLETGQRAATMNLIARDDTLAQWRDLGRLFDALADPQREASALIGDLERRLRGAGVDPETHWAVVMLKAMRGQAAVGAPVPVPLYWHDSYAAYRGTEAFRALAGAQGLPEYWRANGFPPQCRAVGGDDFVCDLPVG